MSAPRRSAVAVVALALSSCVVAPADFARARGSIEARTGLSLHLRSSMHVGPALLAFARAWSGAAGTDEALSRVERVEMATYEVAGGSPRRAVDAFEAGPRWALMVRARRGAEAVRVYLDVGAETRGGSMRLLVVAADHQSLTLVRLEGAIDVLLEEALSGRLGGAKEQEAPDDGTAADEAHEPDEAEGS